jgi:hypothetical protein
MHRLRLARPFRRAKVTSVIRFLTDWGIFEEDE